MKISSERSTAVFQRQVSSTCLLTFAGCVLAIAFSETLQTSAQAKTQTPAPNRTEVVGPMLGSVEATTAQILYRPAAKESALRLTVLAMDGKTIQTVDASASEENDFVAKFIIGNLSPNTEYRYSIAEQADAAKAIVPADKQFGFKTANPARTGHSTTVAFVSCVDTVPNPMWAEMESLKIDTLCLMGDTPYIDVSDLTIVRKKHRAFLQLADLHSLTQTVPTVGTWDDHDFGKNNSNGRNMMAGKPQTRQAFVEYRAHSQYGNGSEGVYHKIDLGMIEAFLLDPRYFSQTEPSPVDAAQTTCFGKDQWNWLLENLRASKAPFKVLATGSIWQDKRNAETDDMFTYWYERDALLDFIKSEKIEGVVLLGGDIHVARHLVHPLRTGYDLHDFIISPGHERVITQLDVFHPSLEWSLVEGHQFLTLTADGTTDTPKLIARFRQPNGVINREVTIPLDAATPKTNNGWMKDLRAHYSFDDDFKNSSVLGNRIDAKPHNGATLAKGEGQRGGAVRFERSKQSFVSIPRSFLDDNSAEHTVALWFKPEQLPAHGSADRHFLWESTAEGSADPKAAWHLSLGLRSTNEPNKINLQVYTSTIKPAEKPEASPTTISQGPFDTILDRDLLAGKWNQVVFTFDSREIKLFLGAEQIAVHKLPMPGPAAEFGGLILGGHREGVGRNFVGLCDDLFIWNRKLSEAEIAAIYRQELDQQR